jgi:hypothetical protein
LESSFFLGHDFSRAKNTTKQAWALRAAEKLGIDTNLQGFVTGHDFSRAANVAK